MVILIDENNAFNLLDRQVALLNIQHLCTPLSTISTNCCQKSAELFVDGSVQYSEDGTTPRDLLVMPMYALAMVPLIKRITENVNVGQLWHADDIFATGKLGNRHSWWNQLQAIGPDFAFFANSVKTWLVVKLGDLSVARDLFGNTEVNITSEGFPSLGAPLSTDVYVQNFVHSKVNQWNQVVTI